MRGVRVSSPLALALLSATAVTPVRAQESRAAFDTLTLAINIVANVNRNDFHDYWDPTSGLEVQAATPFYLGRTEAGVHYAGFNANEPEQPDFATLFAYLGWGIEWPITRRVAWYNGARAGTLIMVFDSAPGNTDEQELGLGLNSQLRYRLAGRWSVELAARYRVVFTHERLRHVFIAAGVSHSFGSPSWLRDFLD